VAQIPVTLSELEVTFVVMTDKMYRTVPVHLQSSLFSMHVKWKQIFWREVIVYVKSWFNDVLLIDVLFVISWWSKCVSCCKTVFNLHSCQRH